MKVGAKEGLSGRWSARNRTGVCLSFAGLGVGALGGVALEVAALEALLGTMAGGVSCCTAEFGWPDWASRLCGLRNPQGAEKPA